jgi:hypothetical protein
MDRVGCRLEDLDRISRGSERAGYSDGKNIRIEKQFLVDRYDRLAESADSSGGPSHACLVLPLRDVHALHNEPQTERRFPTKGKHQNGEYHRCVCGGEEQHNAIR